jgi:hypothetical protein
MKIRVKHLPKRGSSKMKEGKDISFLLGESKRRNE